MLSSQCPSCDHLFWIPRVQPRRFSWGLLRINAYFCPSCDSPLRLQRWVIWVRSVAIFLAIASLFVARGAPDQASAWRVTAIVLLVLSGCHSNGLETHVQ